MAKNNEKKDQRLGTKYSSSDLKKMQSWSLEKKIQTTIAKLLEWYKGWDGQCYVSFSGGKDSVVLAYLAAKVCQETGDELTLWFCNTGLEFPEIVRHVKFYGEWLKEQFPTVQIDLIMDYPRRGKVDKKLGKPKHSRVLFKDVIQEYGYPLISKEVAQKIYEARLKPDGSSAKRFEPNNEHTLKYGGYDVSKWAWLKDSDIPISHMCCRLMKEYPAIHYETRSKKKRITAIMVEESSSRKTEWLKDGCNAFDTKRPHSNPMAFWKNQDVLKFISEYNIPIADIYGEIKVDDDGKYYTTGRNRTGCMYCGFGCHLEKEPNRFQQLKQTHPKIWEYCMKPLDDGGLGMRSVLECIGVKVE